MRNTHAQPYEEQRAHGDELHEEVAAVRQRSAQDVGQLCWALDDLVHLLEEGAADQALHTRQKQNTKKYSAPKPILLPMRHCRTSC
jgi:hypothetical protein